MRVHVDKARRYDTPTGVDLTPRTAFQVRRYGGNAPTADAHVRSDTWCACAVDYRAMFNQ